MKNIITILFLLVVIETVSYSQNDIVVINKDTIKCKIIRNSKDTVTYLSGESIFKVYKDYLVNTSLNKKKVGISLKAVKFYRDPKCVNTVFELFRDKVIRNSNLPDLYWFGIDFSAVSVKLGIAPRTQYSNLFYLDCNDFVLSEKGLKNFRKYFNFIIDTGIATNKNSKIDPTKTFLRNSKAFTVDSLRTLLGSLNSGHTGTGVVVFITNIDKERDFETFHIVFFDIKTKCVLLCFDETLHVSGIGMANHWTRSIIEELEQLVSNQTEWRDKYLR